MLGTGKTTTIAAAVQIWESLRHSVWVVAQSNVATKNLAESLSKRGIKFKIIVSKEFYHEWYVYSPCYIRILRMSGTSTSILANYVKVSSVRTRYLER
jgi:hypothetical protein